MRLDDERLRDDLEGCANRDRTAFRSLYDKTKQPLFGIIRRMVRDEELTQDILQRGYLSVWKRAETYDRTRGKAFTWILVIMRNQAIDLLRAPHRQTDFDSLPDNLTEPKSCPDRSTERTDILAHLRASVDMLPERLAFVIRLRFFHDKSVREICEAYRLSSNTVRSWLRRGLILLKQIVPAEFRDSLRGWHMDGPTRRAA